MPATVYYDEDGDLSIIQGRKVAVIGYGAQGKAHALNLRDSGVDVRVGLPAPSASVAKAEAEGLRVTDPASAAKEADLVMLLIPDQHHKEVFERDIAPSLEPGNAFFVAHGFSIHFRQVVPAPEVDVAMVAPKGPGDLVRRTYVEGAGTPSLLAVHQDASGNAHRLGLSYAKGLGATRAGVLETTFLEETETDLFGEQVVLCGGLTALILAGFETLVEGGYQPESAYYETLHEVKLIVDLLYEGGLARMRQVISDTAEYGDLTRGPRIVTGETRKEMRRILEEIQSGAFATEFILENQAGRPRFEALRRRAAQHPIEEVGAQLRSMMPWLAK